MEINILVNGRTERWYWMMDWCIKHGKHPAQQQKWFEAIRAYDKVHKTKHWKL